MFTFHLVNWANRSEYEQQLFSYFRMRHDIYVQERQWLPLERPVPLEIDAFDTAAAVYLLGIDARGDLAGASRFVPTPKPHLLSDIFPGLAEHNPPIGNDIWEWSRFFVAPALRTEGTPSPASGRVLAGVLEASLSLGIRQLSVVCETFWVDRLTRLGWSMERLGPEFAHVDGSIVALLIEITPEALAATRAAYGLYDTTLLANSRQAMPVKQSHSS